MDIKNLELTKDPLTNIGIMIPMLNDRAREAMSYFMYGFCLGESVTSHTEIADQDKQLQEV